MTTATHSIVCFGEVLWDILPHASLPGGAPMNVAYHLKQFGYNPAMITKIGTDDYGHKLLQLFKEKDIATQYVQQDEQQPTGLVYAQPNENNEVSYDIVFPSAWDFIEWKEELNTLVQGADLLIYGSLATRNHTSRETLYKLIKEAKTKVLDINLRPPHFSQQGVEELLLTADILKLNEGELQLIAGWYAPFEGEEQAITLLQNRFNIHLVIVTKGGDGAVVKKGRDFYSHPGFTVQVADTIGSGDSFLAGFLSQYLKDEAVDKALAFACGVGALIASKQGGCPDYDIKEIDALMQKDVPAND